MSTETASPRLLRIGEVLLRTGLSRSTLYEKIKSGEFDPPVRIGLRAVAFQEKNVDAWISARVAASNSAEQRAARVAASNSAKARRVARS